ncbi:MAG: ligand-binding sensor domain-containing protein, partial [Bacteroidales bacterium]
MRRILLLLFIIHPIFSPAQIEEIGSPRIHNYPKSVYQAGTQNWGITQDKNGFIYFANNEGVLIFDGLHWEQVIVSKAKPVRSIFIGSDSRIYVGLLNDFGYLDRNEKGLYFYKSLRENLPPEINDFDDIWKIYETPEGIVFQTYEYLFIKNNENISALKPNTRFQFSFYVNGRLFLQEPGFGIFEYTNRMISEVSWSDELKDKEIWQIIDMSEGNLLICTSGEGIYLLENGVIRKWNTPVNRLLEEYKLFGAEKLIGDFIAFGTILNGLIISDYNGNIIQHINKSKGLQNNTVLSLFSDASDNLWLGLDNGIDYIEINSPLTYFSSFEGIGTGYYAKIYNNKLYLGTNQGVFVKSFNEDYDINSSFELLNNTAGQVWSIYEFDGELICGHDLGTFSIKNGEAKMISSEEGAWKYITLENQPGYILGGHYNGLVLLKKVNDQWVFHKKLKGYNESSRFLQQDKKGNIWVSHGARGIYKIQLSENLDSVTSFKLYTSSDNLPSNEENIIMKLDDNVFVSTVDGIYIYDEASDKFIKSDELNTIFNLNGRLKTIEKDQQGNVWFIAQNESGILRLNQDNTYTKITAPLKQLHGKYVNEFEFIYPYSLDHVLLGVDNGFAHYSANLPKSYSTSYKSFITEVELPYIDSVIYYPYITDSLSEFSFPFNKNSFRFNFTSPFYENIEELNFSYMLEGYSDEWSDWSPVGFKDFINLREGKYTFKLKAKNIYDFESEVSSFQFSIKPPWHRSRNAYYLFSILIILFALAVAKYIHERIKLSKKKEREKLQRELYQKEKQFQHEALISEKEIIKLRNEKLRAEMVHRDKELANQTMNIIQKNKLLSRLKKELDQIQKSTEDSQLRTKILIINRR